MNPNTDLPRGTALVTGAAGGIGGAIVRALGEHGVTVAAVDRAAARPDALAEKARADGLDVHPFTADVSNERDVEALLDDVERSLGAVGSLVNAAGVLRPGPAHALSHEDWARTFAVNTTGVFLVSRAVVRRMLDTRRTGAVVTVASNAAGTPRTDMAAYAASKAAATMYTKCLGLEVARHGIRCNVVAPGSTETAMLTSLWRDPSGRTGTLEGAPDQYRVGIPLGRIADPVDIAEAAVYLLSDRARHITLQSLVVDGGATLGVSA
ncbi:MULTISPECIES: 2,3-dihydro-2,3-dihydroxybenzoate dehydrogenase [Streptomyces]|uniref:2,3-dihydro-2,3-dihydroxybenzoate dehydrogenase n=1 Tax=Streptomyces TaxID=1883 RepID=UPI001E5C6C57|nr:MULTISPECIES: 2,3-dihydro-2,3-dihydroxybenzoate dehydrogenase [Streptomyces]